MEDIRGVVDQDQDTRLISMPLHIADTVASPNKLQLHKCPLVPVFLDL